MMKSFFAERKSRIPLERLHKTTIKTEMNEDSKIKKLNFSHNDYLIVRVLLTQKLNHVYFLGNCYNSNSNMPGLLPGLTRLTRKDIEQLPNSFTATG